MRLREGDHSPSRLFPRGRATISIWLHPGYFHLYFNLLSSERATAYIFSLYIYTCLDWIGVVCNRVPNYLVCEYIADVIV